MRKELHLGNGATFHFGIREMEELNPGILFLGAGLTLILRRRSVDGSDSWGALDYSKRRNGRFIIG